MQVDVTRVTLRTRVRHVEGVEDTITVILDLSDDGAYDLRAVRRADGQWMLASAMPREVHDWVDALVAVSVDAMENGLALARKRAQTRLRRSILPAHPPAR